MGKLITIAEAMELLGMKYPAQVHQFIKKNPSIAKVKKGKNTFVDEDQILTARAAQALKGNRTGGEGTKRGGLAGGKKSEGGKKKKAKKTVTEQVTDPVTGEIVEIVTEVDDFDMGDENPGYFKPFKEDPRFLLWNKGLFRGWAVRAVKEIDGTLANMVSAHGKENAWVQKALLADIVAGKAFFIEPQEVLRFIEAQLILVKDNHPDIINVVKQLESSAKQLDTIRDQITNPKGTEDGQA